MGCLANRRIILGTYVLLGLSGGTAQADSLVQPPNMVPRLLAQSAEGTPAYLTAPPANSKPAYLTVPYGTAGTVSVQAPQLAPAIAPAANSRSGAPRPGETNGPVRATVLAQPLPQPQPQTQPQSQASSAPPVQDTAARAAIFTANRNAALKDPAIGRLDALSAADWTAQPTQVLFSTYGGLVTVNGASASVPMMQQPELLQEFTCNHVLSKSFTRTQRAVTVLVYTFPDARGAFGAYSSMRTGSSTVLVRGDASSEDENSISFWRGQRFVVLTTSADEDETSKHLISKLADELSRTIDTSLTKPQLVTTLPQLDRVAGSERFFMGSIGARKHISIPFMQMLSIEKSNGAAFAEYQFPRPLAERMKALLIDYRDPEIARRVYEGYSAALAASHKPQMAQPNMEISKVGETYMLCGINGARVTIISGARRKVSPLVLARQFAY